MIDKIIKNPSDKDFIIERLQLIQTELKEYLSDEDQRDIREAIFYLRMHPPISECDDQLIQILKNTVLPSGGLVVGAINWRTDFRGYARDHVGKKIYVMFSFYDLYTSSTPVSQEILNECKEEFKDGIFTIVDQTSLQSVENEDLMLDVGHNFLSSFYELTEDNTNDKN